MIHNQSTTRDTNGRMAKGKHIIRNLVPSGPTSHNKLGNKVQSKCYRFTRIGLLLAVCTTILGILLTYYDNVIEMHRRLRTHVDRQYNFHLYGVMDYCNQTFDPNTLTEPLKLHIINQNDALNQISGAIQNFDGVVSIALIGGSGVGKTLTCNVMQSNFQWPSNVLYFVWTSIHSKSSQDYRIMNSVKKNSKKCGAHLVIVDSIDIANRATIQELDDEIKKEFSQSGISILVVYVFNLASYSDDDLQTMDTKRHRLEYLNGITSINFKSFDRYDVEHCIVRESAKLNVALNDQEIVKIFEYIDVSRSGCKLIHSKIAMYTT